MKAIESNDKTKFLGVKFSIVVSLFTLLFAFGVSAEILDKSSARIRAVMAVQEELTPDLMTRDGVLGTAVGLQEEKPVMIVFFDEGKKLSQVIRLIRSEHKGIKIVIEYTDKFRALARPGTPSLSHKAYQTPPIKLGTSGGWRSDLANGYCCGGTLGSLVSAGNTQYILSNYHVFESDIVAGGNNLIAGTGDPVIQPGLIDVMCAAGSAQNVGSLVKLSALPSFNVDVGIAEVLPGMVSDNGSILGIGTVSNQIVAPNLNQLVKKSGRTSGLTKSSVSGLNATVSVAYEDECAGDAAFTKTFTNQIIIKNKGSKFLTGGDSGSLMVEDISTSPRSVGLLFAGSSTLAVANPINEVLQFISGQLGETATMVGNSQ